MIENVIEAFVCIVNGNVTCLKLFNDFYDVFAADTSDLPQERKRLHLRGKVDQIFRHSCISWQGDVLELNIDRDVVRDFAVVGSIFVGFEEDD